MSEQIILFAKPCQYTAKHATIDAYFITGMEQEDGQRLEVNSSDTRFPDLKHEKLLGFGLLLGQQAVERLVDFYDRTHVRSTDLSYDCFGFVTYLAGTETGIFNGGTLKNAYGLGAPAGQSNLTEGGVYGIYDNRDKPIHALIGGMHPDANLSVIGQGDKGEGMLMYMANQNSLELYKGVGIAELVTQQIDKA